MTYDPHARGHPLVWNRRATKKGGKVNPVGDWVLSAQPTHPAIISHEEYAAAAAVSGQRERSKSGDATEPAPGHAVDLSAALLRHLW